MENDPQTALSLRSGPELLEELSARKFLRERELPSRRRYVQKVSSHQMDEDFIFSCSSDSPRLFSQALTSIAWRRPESQTCSVRVSEGGILFTTEDVKTLQAGIFFKTPVFQSFTLAQSSPYDFRLNLTALVNCLMVFAETATLLDISGGNGSDLRIAIHDMGSLTECTIRTLHATPDQANQPTLADLCSSKVNICEFSISSVVLREVFRFPDERKNKSVSVEMTIDRPNNCFVVKTEGIYGALRSRIDFNRGAATEDHQID
jgi:hypothetical protein